MDVLGIHHDYHLLAFCFIVLLLYVAVFIECTINELYCNRILRILINLTHTGQNKWCFHLGSTIPMGTEGVREMRDILILSHWRHLFHILNIS